jgi:ribonucleotide monophosphatase NagD (HAD superfamily)
MIYCIVFDWKRTLYNPDDKTLIDGGLDLLELLKKSKIPLVLIGKGNSDMYLEVERLGVKDFFQDVIFHEGEKDSNLFMTYLSIDTKETLFIGDRVRSELEIGNKLGTTTIWVRQGKFAKEDPLSDSQKPTFVVNSLVELKEFLQNNFLQFG